MTKRCIIKDTTSFYNGRGAIVLNVHKVAGVVVLWLKCGYAELAVREENVDYV